MKVHTYKLAYLMKSIVNNFRDCIYVQGKSYLRKFDNRFFRYDHPVVEETMNLYREFISPRCIFVEDQVPKTQPDMQQISTNDLYAFFAYICTYRHTYMHICIIYIKQLIDD